MNAKTRHMLDMYSPLFASLGAFIGAAIFMIAYQCIFRNDARFVDFYDGKEYFLVFCMYALILPMIFSYSLCPCTCYFKGLVAISYGSLGGALGAFVSFLIFIVMLYLGFFFASSLLFISPVISGIFSYLFHRIHSHLNDVKSIDDKIVQNLYYHPMTYQFYQYPLDYLSKNPVSL